MHHTVALVYHSAFQTNYTKNQKGKRWLLGCWLTTTMWICTLPSLRLSGSEENRGRCWPPGHKSGNHPNATRQVATLLPMNAVNVLRFTGDLVSPASLGNDQ